MFHQTRDFDSVVTSSKSTFAFGFANGSIPILNLVVYFWPSLSPNKYEILLTLATPQVFPGI